MEKVTVTIINCNEIHKWNYDNELRNVYSGTRQNAYEILFQLSQNIFSEPRKHNKNLSFNKSDISTSLV
jgi:hypothetical protein